MVKAISLKILRFALLLICASILAFTLIALSPIDPVTAYVGVGANPNVSIEQRENIIKYWGLDKPPFERFIIWAKRFFTGDMGESMIYREPVINVIKDRAGNSFLLMGTSWILSGLIGVTIGIFMGIYKDSIIDKILRAVCIFLYSTPTFWVGILLLMVFGVYLGIFPIGLSVPIGSDFSNVSFTDRLYHLVLPALALSLTGFSVIAMQTREKMIQVLNSDYVTFAKARGKSLYNIVFNHGLKNSILPIITLQFASISELFGGSILAEQVFAYPGLGQAAVQAGLRSDAALLLAITVFSTALVFIGNTIADILYRIVDPRIRKG